jgi:hypothetical protein
MTIPQSILIGSVIIGGCIIGTQFAAPYRLASGTAVVWRLNAIAGEMRYATWTLTSETSEIPIAGNVCR